MDTSLLSWRHRLRQFATALLALLSLGLPPAARSWTFEPLHYSAPAGAMVGASKLAHLAADAQLQLQAGAKVSALRYVDLLNRETAHGEGLIEAPERSALRQALRAVSKPAPEAHDWVALHAALDPYAARLERPAGRVSPALARLFAQQPEDVKALNELALVPLDVRQLTEPEAQAYARATQRGARDPQLWLTMEDLLDEPLSREWRSVAENRRVMIMGPSSAADRAAELAAAIRRHGGASFFYLDCVEILSMLCDPERVAAMAATAGTVLVIDPEKAATSLFLNAEIRTAMRMRARLRTGPGAAPYGVVFKPLQ